MRNTSAMTRWLCCGRVKAVNDICPVYQRREPESPKLAEEKKEQWVATMARIRAEVRDSAYALPNMSEEREEMKKPKKSKKSKLAKKAKKWKARFAEEKLEADMYADRHADALGQLESLARLSDEREALLTANHERLLSAENRIAQLERENDDIRDEVYWRRC